MPRENQVSPIAANAVQFLAEFPICETPRKGIFLRPKNGQSVLMQEICALNA